MSDNVGQPNSRGNLLQKTHNQDTANKAAGGAWLLGWGRSSHQPLQCRAQRQLLGPAGFLCTSREHLLMSAGIDGECCIGLSPIPDAFMRFIEGPIHKRMRSGSGKYTANDSILPVIILALNCRCPCCSSPLRGRLIQVHDGLDRLLLGRKG